MVALQTSDSNPRTEPIRRATPLRVVGPAAPNRVEPPVDVPERAIPERWSRAHPAVRAHRGDLGFSPTGTAPHAVPGRDAVRERRPGRRSRWVYLRRRAVAAVVLLALMWAGVAVVTEMVGGGSGSAGATEEVRSHVVVPGDTWWSLAGDLDRPGDIRDAVASLIELNGSEDLRAGQRVVLPLG